MFFTAAAATAVGLVLVAQSQQWKRDAQPKAPTSNPDSKPPFRGEWDAIRNWWHTDTRGRFLSVTEDRDVNGAQIFLVDKGNGAKVVQYSDPREQL